MASYMRRAAARAQHANAVRQLGRCSSVKSCVTSGGGVEAHDEGLVGLGPHNLV